MAMHEPCPQGSLESWQFGTQDWRMGRWARGLLACGQLFSWTFDVVCVLHAPLRTPVFLLKFQQAATHVHAHLACQFAVPVMPRAVAGVLPAKA